MQQQSARTASSLTPGADVLLDDLAAELGATPEVGPVVMRPEHSSIEITDVMHDSRRVGDGTLFCAVPGLTVDGHDFLASAKGNGAAAALVERYIDAPELAAMPQLRVDDVRRSMAHAASIVHGRPSQALNVFGITGTNGKTTTTNLLADILGHVGAECSVIGTLDGIHTTPESTDLQRTLRALADGGVDVVSLEVSSHALDQGRVDATDFAVAAFSNLTPDHLDYHGDMQSYFDAKAQLFDGRANHELINVDDPWGRRLAGQRPNAVPVTMGAVDITREHLAGTEFTWRDCTTSVAIPGRMNVANALMALEAAALLVDVDDQSIADGLGASGSVDGRMQVVPPTAEGQPTVVVDYSHTPDSIERALETLRSSMAGRGHLGIVFGCGGDRDRAKRPLMARAAEQGADRVYLTSDNPRTEEPQAIIDDALGGVDDRSAVIVEVDRRRAIERAIIDAGPADVVLIAGKGHERTQTIGAKKLPFDDVAVAQEILKALDT